MNINQKIEKINHKGAAQALFNRLENLKSDLTISNWDAIRNATHFTRLGEAINDAEWILKEMRLTLEALRELEPDNF